MPRILLVCAALAAGCSFKADYTGGHYTCTDGKCPSGLMCINGSCSLPTDAKVDAVDAPGPGDAVDAKMAALTCTDPGVIPATGGTFMGNTTGGANKVSASCGGFVMNGFDEVYRFDATVGQHIMVMITGSLNAYVLSPCTPYPQTPACLGNVNGSSSVPLNLTAPATGQYFIVVDSPTAGTVGTYTLTVSH